MSRVHNAKVEEEQLACGCAGSEARSFAPQSAAGQPGAVPQPEPLPWQQEHRPNKLRN